MWIVQLALRRPYTFVIMSLLIVILGVLAVLRMPTDIFPEIDIPVVSVIWSYSGVSPEEMSEIVTVRSERNFTTNVNDIEHMESQSLPGLSVIKLYFHPNAKVEAAVGQLAAGSQSMLRSLPQGITPPTILRYNASSVPILQLSISSRTMSEQSIYDWGYNQIRTQLSNVQGASFPLPYGGRPRQIMVDLDPKRMFALGLSAAAADETERDELARLNGTWKAVSVVKDGQDLPKAEAEAMVLTIAGEKYTLKTIDQQIEGTHKLDPTKKPKQIDATRTKGPDAGQKMLGIYELKDDTFTVCFNAPGKTERPTEFKSAAGSGHKLITMKREKP